MQPWRRLLRQLQAKLVQQEFVVPIPLGVTRQDETEDVVSGQVNIHLADGGKILLYPPWSPPGRMGPRKILQGDLEAEDNERLEELGLDPFLLLVKHRPEGKVMFQFPGSLLDFGEP